MVVDSVLVSPREQEQFHHLRFPHQSRYMERSSAIHILSSHRCPVFQQVVDAISPWPPAAAACRPSPISAPDLTSFCVRSLSPKKAARSSLQQLRPFFWCQYFGDEVEKRYSTPRRNSQLCLFAMMRSMGLGVGMLLRITWRKVAGSSSPQVTQQCTRKRRSLASRGRPKVKPSPLFRVARRRRSDGTVDFRRWG